MKIFYQLLVNSLIATVTNFFVWFSVIYWAYLGTKSVISTSVIGGLFLIAMAFSGFWFGSIVDHTKKKTAMLMSSFVTLGFFILGFTMYLAFPAEAFTSVASSRLWMVVVVLLLGVIVGNIRNIALPTLVTLLVSEDGRDKANGLVGMVMGIAFAGANVGAGLVVGFGGLYWVLVSGMAITALAILHLLFISIPEKEIIHTQEEPAQPKKIDIRGTIAAVKAVPGLFGLIFFTTFNNFLGGIFMALMDAYGLSLVSVQVWGTLWGVLSLGFIVGGIYIAKYGLGSRPLATLFKVNIIMWTVCIFFTIQPSIILLAIGSAIYVCLIPFIEATEQTIVQKVVPYERQGRVIGFAQSVEQTASPITAFLIGPIAQYIFIPFMTTGAGVNLIGDWFGTGPGRGLALVFVIAGIIGLIVTLLAKRSRSYQLLTQAYLKK